MKFPLLLVLAGSLTAAAIAQDSTVSVPVREGALSARLAMPQGPNGKMPVVLFVSGAAETTVGGVRNLSNALAAEGIASLRYDRRMPAVSKEGDAGFEAEVSDAALLVSFLRNDARFSTITVADETGSTIGTAAARAARADTAITFSLDQPTTVAKAVRDVEAKPKPPRNMGQRASLRDTVIATIDGARISIEHGRPSKRGRVIWGSLVPWTRWWMPGADESTTLTTTRALTIGTLEVPAGDYTIYTQPGDSAFLLIINRELGQFHTTYHPAQDLGRVPMTKEANDPIAERLTFAIEPRSGGGGVLKLVWDDRAYVVPFSVGK
jgi:hypothetical protein